MSLSPTDMRKVGGSDIAALLNMSPYQGPVGVWARIIHGVEVPETPAMRRGKLLEPAVLDWYAQETGRALVRNVSLGGMGERYRASFDGFSCVPYVGPPNRVVEAKTVGRGATGAWGEPGTDQVPDGYALQCQWYMGHGIRNGLIQDKLADIPVLLAGDFALYQLTYDPEVFGWAEDAAARFWRDHVETGRPPADTPTAQDASLVARIRRKPGLPPISFDALPLEAQQALLAHLRTERLMDAAEARSNARRVAAQLAVAGHGGVTGLPPECGYSRVTWDERKGRTSTDWEAAMRDLASVHCIAPQYLDDLIEKHTKTSSPTRAWCPKPRGDE